MSELEEALATLLEHVPGAVFAAVGGMDGLLVEQAPGVHEELPEVVAELTTVVSVSRRTIGQLLGGGGLESMSLSAETLSAGIWIVSEDFYCFLVSRTQIDMEATRGPARAAVETIRGSLT